MDYFFFLLKRTYLFSIFAVLLEKWAILVIKLAECLVKGLPAIQFKLRSFAIITKFCVTLLQKAIIVDALTCFLASLIL